MTCITVGLGDRSYDIQIRAGLLKSAGQALGPFARGGKLIIVTDSNVAAHVAPQLIAALANGGIAADLIVLPAGEATKCWAQLSELCDALLAREVDRATHIVALGGGVIGDLVGFAAAILKRGCKFIQIPTTLLAQVDSSVGGKTAINTAAGKNLIGAFHQPALVLIDPEVLDTLPLRDMKAGYAEVVKYGLLGDFAFFEWCELNWSAVFAGDRAAQIKAIQTSVEAKARIVEADERETEDKRALLNLGHTFGHALEAETGFSDRLLHGEGVAAGMALAFGFSAATGRCERQDAVRVAAHLKATGLPHDLASAGIAASGTVLCAHMMHDKKKEGSTLPFILPRAIGDAYVARDVSMADVEAFLDGERTL
jgi:3-dehydroquinate synthase